MMPSRNHLCNDVGFAGGELTPVRVATAAPSRHAVVGGRPKRPWHLPTFNNGERIKPSSLQ